MTTLAKPTQPQTYLNLALYAFALLGLEILLLVVEPVLPLTPGSVEAAIMHWVVTIIIWVGGSIALLAWALRPTDFGLRGDTQLQMTPTRWLAPLWQSSPSHSSSSG